MPELTLSWVSDLSDTPDARGNYYINCTFEEWEDIGYIGKKGLDRATEVKGLLEEAKGKLQHFELESAKPSKSGKPRWKILEFGTPGGAATYTAPSIQGGAGSQASRSGPARVTRPPELNTEASIRASVALKAAVELSAAEPALNDITVVLDRAERFDIWLATKASEPASSAYGDGSGTVSHDSQEDQAGVGSDESSVGVFESSLSAPTDSAEGAGGEREASPAPSPHIHDYQLRQGVRGFLVCSCGKTTKKVTV